MEPFVNLLTIVLSFLIIALASRQLGDFISRTSLPLISGFLLTGILAGPYMLDLISAGALERLVFVDKISLSYIAFAAGSKLYLKDMKERLKSIQWISISLILTVFIICSLTMFMLTGLLPFPQPISTTGRTAISILSGAILVTLSPSAVIPVVHELRAKGPFTQTVVGVTMVTEVAAIALFAANISIADSLITGIGVNIRFLLTLVLELSLSILLGFILGRALMFVMLFQVGRTFKTVLILSAGYGIYALCGLIRLISARYLPVDVLMEPLLICMIGGFMVTNYCDSRIEFSKILNEIGPPIYIAFFTLIGASLKLDALVQTWPVALLLLLARAGSIGLGTFAGGTVAGEPMAHNRISWMAYVAQAGVSLGLAKAIAVEFPEWGEPFTAILIAVIVLNQLIGPPLLKRAISLVGESHTRAESGDSFDSHRAVIFGLESQSLALAHSLTANGWIVKIIAPGVHRDDIPHSGIEIHPVNEISLETLDQLQVGDAETVVAMLSDEENYRICELAYENYGTANLVVRLNERANINRFHELGALIVDPGTALVNLMDQFVRSPSAASLLMGMEKNQKIIEVELRNPNLHGIALRDLRLPLDTLILSIHRQGQMLISHGYTRLEVGDMVTVVGPPERLEEVALRFDTNREHALAYLVGKVAAREIATKTLAADVEHIIRGDAAMGGGPDKEPRDRFDRFIEESIVLDINQPMEVTELFRIIAEALSTPLRIPAQALNTRLMEREKESSTAISRWLAIPHIIISGNHRFTILLARCRQGIRFSDSAPMVHAVFVLAGTRDERNFHLQALSAIAQVVQTPNFEHQWLRAKNEKALREVVLQADRKRVR